MGRPWNLPPPLADLAAAAGSVQQLRHLMGDVPASTMGRWKRLLEAGQPLPRSATTAIKQAQSKLAKRRKPRHDAPQEPATPADRPDHRSAGVRSPDVPVLPGDEHVGPIC